MRQKREKQRSYQIPQLNIVQETPTQTLAYARIFKVKAASKKKAEAEVELLNSAWMAGQLSPIPMQQYNFDFTHMRTGTQRTYSVVAEDMELAQHAASQLHEMYKEAHGLNLPEDVKDT